MTKTDELLPIPQESAGEVTQADLTSEDKIAASRIAHDGEWDVATALAFASHRLQSTAALEALLSQQQARADQQAEWAIQEAQKAASLEAKLAKAREAARNITPYLNWTIGPESPGHHPTMPSAVAHFAATLKEIEP